MSEPDSKVSDPKLPIYKPFTNAEHIKQLNDIDSSIAQLLKSAGLALETLSSSQSASTHAQRQAAFQKNSDDYFATLHKVDVGLKRQIWALEEADVIPKEKAKLKRKVILKDDDNDDDLSDLMTMKKKATVASEAPPVEGGMGKLDIGWLNSRSGQVERDMEAELWAKARVFLEKTENGTKNGGANSP